MAVRNLEAINRHGEMIAQQQNNAKKMREDRFWSRVSIIKRSCDDAIDFVDTVDALCKNGMRTKFENWMEEQNLCYRICDKEFCIGTSSSGRVYYVPKSGDVCFGWNNYGMFEYYSLNEGHTDYIIHQALIHRVKYDECLTLMAERLQPFIDAFFKWVDTL